VEGSTNLKQPISPITSAIKRLQAWRRSSPVYEAREQAWRRSSSNRYYKILDSFRNEDGRETSYVQELFKCTTPITDIAITDRFQPVTHMVDTPYFKDTDSPHKVEEVTDVLFAITGDWVHALAQIAIIHSSCTIKARYTMAITGRTTTVFMESTVTCKTDTIHEQANTKYPSHPRTTPVPYV
jgi:hypothetical protein